MYRFFGICLRTHFLREQKPQRRGKVSRARRVPPCLETLEDRLVPSSSSWTEYNYNAAGTRDNTTEHMIGTNNVANLQVQWEFPTQGAVASTPAAVGNTVYAGDLAGNFYALTRSGQLLWQTKVNGPVADSPLVVNNTVIFGTVGDFAADVPGTIYGLNARTGQVLWTTQPQPNDPLSAIYGSATLVGNNVAIGVASNDEVGGLPVNISPQPPPSSRGSLVLLDPNNGQIIWQTSTVVNGEFGATSASTGAAIWSTPAYDPQLGLIYAGTGNNYTTPTTGTEDAMIAFNAKTGAIVWVNQQTSNDAFNGHLGTGPDFDFGDSPHIYMLPNGETVVASGQKSGIFYVFDAKTGTLVNNGGIDVVPGGVLGGFHETAAVDPTTGVVFAPSNHPTSTTGLGAIFGTGDLTAISGDGTQILWQFSTPSPDITGVDLANGVVYVEDLGGTMYALDENTGKMLAQFFVGGGISGPSISDGQIFIGQGSIFGEHGPGGIVALGLSRPQENAYSQTNLVSDGAVPAEVTDSSLKNPWGVSHSTTSPFWVSDQATNDATLYSVASSGVSKLGLTVSIPTTSTGPQGPTGQVFNPTVDFLIPTSDGGNGQPARFIFASLNGTISAWNGDGTTPPGTNAHTVVTTSGAVYTGLAIGSNAQGTFLYAADNSKGTIDVFNSSFNPVTLGTGGFGTFTDPLLPSASDLKLVPFNVQNINGELYVTYAPAGHPAQTAATPGEGAVAIFDTNGNFIRQLIIGGPLASPWGITLAPPTFGAFGGDLLVGNFAYNYSSINAFDPVTGKFLGTLTDANGQPILNSGLWTLTFGNGGIGGDPNTLYFSAGINGEKDGLFGSIQPVVHHGHDGGGNDQGKAVTTPSSATPLSTTPSLTPPSSTDMLAQQVDAFFQAFDAALLTLEMRLTAIDPQLFSFFQTLNGNLDTLEDQILSEL